MVEAMTIIICRNDFPYLGPFNTTISKTNVSHIASQYLPNNVNWSIHDKSRSVQRPRVRWLFDGLFIGSPIEHPSISIDETYS